MLTGKAKNEKDVLDRDAVAYKSQRVTPIVFLLFYQMLLRDYSH